jgi:hypothetical protein
MKSIFTQEYIDSRRARIEKVDSLFPGELAEALDEIERLQAALTEAINTNTEQRRTIERLRDLSRRVHLTINDWEKLKVVKDGNAFMVVGPDFANLQVSPSVWFDENTYVGSTLKGWYGVSPNPLVHISMIEIASIIDQLNKAEPQP